MQLALASPRRKYGIAIDGAPPQALAAGGWRAFCRRDADKFFAGGESRAILCFIAGKARSGVGRPRFRRGAAVNEGSGKSLKLQSAPSSKGLTKLDRT
jgi:hypothetical protein